MTKTHIVIPDQHAHPDFHNNRADYIGQLIKDLKPDVVVNMGDAADLASLSSYDKGKSSFHGRNYEKDINSHLDFQSRMWEPIRKAKKKMPYRVVLEGNHEHRIKKALDRDPELEGTKFGISFNDLAFKDYYDEVVEYTGNTPGTCTIDGITYAHYLVSGLLGKPVGGEHHALSLIAKYHSSCTVAHSHTFDYSTRNDIHGRKLHGLVAGVYQDYHSGWAGTVNNLWTSGVVIKRQVEDGTYGLQFITMKELEKEYGS